MAETCYGVQRAPQVNAITTWTEPNCQGICTTTTLDEAAAGRNISLPCVSQSFQLVYPLGGQQQLDLSDVTDTALLQPADGTAIMLDQFCMLFKSSFFTLDKPGLEWESASGDRYTELHKRAVLDHNRN
ncbi:hypothetical protein BJY01DRAFT_256613 [Aspergillus pseudoustus]|uniref:Uncharacterized protein n=1 Tax=Aspergillus pseudoustus TaxID=1810923 RepID=A0ABR4I6Z2_9EURO